jgi:serine/threonine-protein kinase HipA
MTRRFDRKDGGEKRHMQSLCGIAHYDFNDAGAYAYEQAIGVMRDLRLSQPELEQFFRRAVFNVIARNQDDHTKNIAFLMDKAGQWSLSPAYDITYCYGRGWTNQHQMTINGKRDHFETADLLALAKHADIKDSKSKAIIDDVLSTVKQWPDFAEQAGIPTRHPDTDGASNWTEEIQKGHRVEWQGF